MKRSKKIVAMVTMLLLILAMAVPVSAAGKISKKKATLVTGQKMQLKLSGTKGKVKWSSSKKSVAAVSSKGVVTAKKKGSATITAKVGKKKYTCKVTVKQKKVVKPVVTPTPEPTPVPEVQYGKVAGNITYHYNQYRGYVADTGAKVYLIPKNGSASEASDLTDMDFAYMLNTNKINANNIYCAKIDGKGEYIIDRIPEGEYFAVIVSKNSKSGDWFETQNKDDYYNMIANGWRSYLNESTSLALAKSISFYRYGLRSVTVYGNDTTTLSYEFTYTYI